MGQKWFTTRVYDFDRGSTTKTPPSPPTRTATPEPLMATEELEELAARLRGESATADTTRATTAEPSKTTSELEELAEVVEKPTHSEACGGCGKIVTGGKYCNNNLTGEEALICWDCCKHLVPTHPAIFVGRRDTSRENTMGRGFKG